MPYATRPAPRFGVCRCIRIKCWRRSSSSEREEDRKSTRLNSSHSQISYAVFCLKKKNTEPDDHRPCEKRTRSEENQSHIKHSLARIDSSYHRTSHITANVLFSSHLGLVMVPLIL